MRFGVLGPLAVWTDHGEPVRISGRKVRALLADLLVHAAEPVSVDRLVEDLWGEAAPANSAGALQVRVSQLRRALDDAEPGARELVVSRAPGYLLNVPPEAVDATRFAALTEQARGSGDPRTRAALLADALALWRGPAYADFADEQFPRAAIVRCDELRLAAYEEQAEARLALGEHRPLAGELADLVARHPYRERLRAAHMRALYRSGRQGEALDSYHDLRRRLADELGLDPSPELAGLHQAILAQDPAEAPAPPAPTASVPATRPRPTTNLPVPLTELMGRDEAVAAVRSLLASGRLVTLTGSGGVGKTRLAVAAGRAMVDELPDGAWLVELAGHGSPGRPGDPDELAGLVLAALEVRDVPGPAAPARQRLAEALGTRHLLLVLDNCEHLAAQVAAVVEPLLQAAPGVRVLATSREPLRVAGEALYEVPPLAEPDAVRLFVARAAAAAGGLSLDAETGPAVAQLCRRLDGIPLALELAATRVRALGVPELLSRLDDRFRVLNRGPRGAPARQQTLAAVIDWSWQLLTEPERVVLRRLAVHADGCTLAAAEAVCGGEVGGVAADDVLDLLARLVDRSLVVRHDPGGAGPRYQLLESVSAYCRNRMYEVGEVTQVRRWHGDYYLGLAERAERQLTGPGQGQWLRRLDVEAANLRAALETALRQASADQALRLVGALTWYWYLRGRLTEARRWLAAALAVPGAAPAAVRAKAQAWHAGVAVLQGDSSWVERHQRVSRGYQEAGDPVGRARAEWFLAHAIIDLGDLAATEELLDRALATFREHGDRWGEAAALSTRAMLAQVRDDPVGLERDARRSAELFGELGDDWGVLQATDWLVGLADMTGDHDQAARLSRDGLRMAEQLGLWPHVAGRLGWLGWISVQRGDYPYARECCEQALHLATEQGARSLEVFATIGLGFAARRDGKLDLAGEHLQWLLDTARRQPPDAGHPLYLPMVLVELGFLAEQRGEAAAALAWHREGFDAYREHDSARGMAWALAGMAAALAADRRHRDAAALLGAAAAAQRATGVPLAATDQAELDRITAAVRDPLAEREFTAAYESGGELPLEQARSLVDGTGPDGDLLRAIDQHDDP